MPKDIVNESNRKNTTPLAYRVSTEDNMELARGRISKCFDLTPLRRMSGEDLSSDSIDTEFSMRLADSCLLAATGTF